MSERPAVSLSMALHCRMKVWLNGHGYAQEIVELHFGEIPGYVEDLQFGESPWIMEYSNQAGTSKDDVAI